ncbi:hypothetical protein GCM10010329_55010 [Streptomyces spiroverticillatus]|uniref:Uncharacterized protein n=1 Tax=Streptomyces finlayi TaxID=67296 RepID=A0A918X2H3_9ACTN|nr:hypothetical protein GCM10010329_55010 [Streptomyces spiroverticillatus]GHD05792.1 hypothetical protein GCM10010334_56800 [Streptomyces finlayi]
MPSVPRPPSEIGSPGELLDAASQEAQGHDSEGKGAQEVEDALAEGQGAARQGEEGAGEAQSAAHGRQKEVVPGDRPP